jgi:ribosomal protein L44E
MVPFAKLFYSLFCSRHSNTGAGNIKKHKDSTIQSTLRVMRKALQGMGSRLF